MERHAPVYRVDRLDSTNTRLKALAREGAAPGTALLVREQSGGRGRLGRRFASPPGGLYLSMLLCPDCSPERCLSLTPLAAVAVHRALRACAGVEAQIKWPNDLLLGGKKLCGILTEGLGLPDGPAVILGIGLNVNTKREAFPPELRDLATSLYEQRGETLELEALAEALIRELDALYAAWLEDERVCLAEYRAACTTPGQQLRVGQAEARREATALAIEEDFSLLVEYPDGSRERLRFGEVTPAAP